ncbi:FAD-binding oxidoreductase [Methylomonas sp. AM2-LC]|uniref:NAD(P)/FAD-dependent oxidoreductase n=1 Tax=Methylomonas sp. AM2-LC TaxID=3153301 RepID=UPI003263849A
MQVDFLIVGQGLAGSLLAWELMQRQYRVLIIDKGVENSSQIAAGLINPITGQRLVKSHDMELLLPEANAFYKLLGKVFTDTFLIEKPMLRILQTATEAEYARRRLTQIDYQSYIQPCLNVPAGIKNDFGICLQTKTAYLRTRLLLSRLRDFFIAQDSYRQISLDYSQLAFTPAIIWKNIRARHLVFCEGYQAQANPWFGELPFQLAKGEILTGSLSGQSLKSILNYRHWLIPLPADQFKIGASFQPKWENLLPTSHAKAELLASLNAVCPAFAGLQIDEHKAGIRPATLDKQPFVGAHPQYANVHIFNGFGAKGSLSIPWYVQHFISALQQGTPLAEHCDTGRYYATHFTA